jgi:hypothetical protein
VKYFTSDDAKNEKLKADRGISFEEIVLLIGQGHVLDILEHQNQQRYGGWHASSDRESLPLKQELIVTSFRKP